MKLIIVNEILDDSSAGVALRAVQYLVPLAQLEWGNTFEGFFLETHRDVSKPYVPTGKDSIFYITERKVHPHAAGYHLVNPISKLPEGYISLRNSGSTFGKFHYPIVELAHKIGTLLFPTRTFGKFSILSQGMITALVHEILEAVADPNINMLSEPSPAGQQWLEEICDPVARNYFKWTDPVTKQDCALPDFVYKAFYSKTATGQMSFLHSISTPFTKAKGGYAYFADLVTKMFKPVA